MSRPVFSMAAHTMKRPRRALQWGASLVLALGVATAGWMLRDRGQSRGPLVPVLAGEAELPPLFQQRLRDARVAVRDTPTDQAALRRLARLYHANRYYAEARACYELLATVPGELDARDRYFLADVALNTGDLGRAQALLQAVVQQEPGYLPARTALAQALLKSGQNDAAAREFAAVLEEQPEHIDAGVGLARIDMQRGAEDAAVARLEELFAARPEATSAVALLAQWMERRGETDRAIALSELSQQRPEPTADDPWLAELDADIFDVRLLGLRFEQLAQRSASEQAEWFLRRIEELQPGTPVTPMLQGTAAAQGGNHQEAVAHFRAALKRGGDPERIGPAVVRSLLAIGQVTEAAAFLAELQAKLPDSIPLLVAFSEVIIHQGKPPHAREILTRVLEVQPYLSPQNMALAEILWQQGDHDAAAVRLRRVAEVDSTQLPARALLGEYYLRRSDAAAALRVLNEAWSLAPADPAVRAQLQAMLLLGHGQSAQAAMHGGDPRAALGHFDNMVALAPRDPRGHAGRAQILSHLRDFAAAAGALEQLAQLQPENPTVFLSLGDVYRQLGRKDVAVGHWTAALRLVAPQDHELRTALELRLNEQPASAAPSP